MGTGTQTHIIFPRRAIPGVSWSPPLERANVPRPDAEGSREFATILAERKAALEGSPQQPPSPEAAARQQGSPSKPAQVPAQQSVRSATVIFPDVDGPSGGAAEPASIGSLIQKFEQAQQAAPKERTGLSPRPAAVLPDGQASERVHDEVQTSSPSKPKWWQRLGRSKPRGAAQGVQQPAARVDAANAEANIDAIKLPEFSKSPGPKKPRRISGKAASATPILTWYRACVSAPETPPAPFLNEDNAPPLSARIAAHRGDPTDLPSICPEAPIVDAPNSDAAAETIRSLPSARGDNDAPCCSLGPEQDTEAGPGAAQAATLCGYDSLGQCLQAGHKSEAGQTAAEEAQAAGLVHGRSQSLGQSLKAEGDGEAGRNAAEAASLDIWLLPKEELSACSVQQGRGNAAPQTPDLSPRTPEVVRESAAASATPAARSSRLSRPPASAPGEPSASGAAQDNEDPDAATGAAVNEIARQSWPAEGSAARSPAQAEAPGVAVITVGTVPTREASEQLEAVRQLADQAAHVQRRARRLVNGRTRQKVFQGQSDSLAAQAADTSRKRASNTSPPPKRARRKDGQRSRTPSPEKVQQLLSDVTAVSEELHARSGRLGMHAAILGDLQSGIAAVRARLKTPSSSPPESDAAPENEQFAAARARSMPPPLSSRASGAAAGEQQAATVMPGAEKPAAAAGASETAAPADGSVAERPGETAQSEYAQLVPAPSARTDAEPEPVQPEQALAANIQSQQGPRQAPDRVAEAAARAQRAIRARRAAARQQMASITEEGTPSPEALQRSALDLARLSTAALTTSMCLLVSVEQGVEISARACEVVCNSLLARVPFGAALLQSIGDDEEPLTRAQPSLGVRAIRGGIRLAYGAAGTVTGVGAGVLRAGAPLALPWRR